MQWIGIKAVFEHSEPEMTAEIIAAGFFEAGLKGVVIESPAIEIPEGAFTDDDLVMPEDIRWMIMLTGKRIKAAWGSADKQLEIDEELLAKCNCTLEKILEGNKHMTKQELMQELEKAGIKTNEHRINRITLAAEADGILCSGAERDKKHTYALLEERVPRAKELHKDEALARLAGQ